MKTAVYTILKNESKYIEKWLYYGKFYDYRVLLDTGSTDGSWEKLQEISKIDENLIIEQKIFNPWRFDVARNYNLDMIPNDVEWCLSPDLDEYFTINTLDELTAASNARPDMTNLACNRMDVYSYIPNVGPQTNQLPSNKIHKRHDYKWVQPIYEHLAWKHSGYETELYSDKIFLIHDQDFQKQERSELYTKMLIDEHLANPSNTWCLWFLVNHYFLEKDMENFVITGTDYVKFSKDKNDSKYLEILKTLKNILFYENISDNLKTKITEIL